MGYYLCSVNQSNCYNTVKAERYGNSIIRPCTVIKNGIDQKKLEVIIKEFAIAALKEAGDTAIDEFILENKYLKVVKVVVKGWLQ